jgi:hypothetical protein
MLPFLNFLNPLIPKLSYLVKKIYLRLKKNWWGKKKNGSLTVIFSVWNTMVGTGMLTIPWAYSNSGLFLGISKAD